MTKPTVRPALLWLLFLTSCNTLPIQNAQEQAEQTFKKDLVVRVDDTTYIGTGVLPNKLGYKITIKPKEKIDRLILQTCHRDETVDKPRTGWMNNEYTFNFIAQGGIENMGSCPIEIAALNKNTKNQFAYFDIQDIRKEISLKAHVKCNGTYKEFTGVGVCQSAEGLTQQVFFKEPVLVEGVGEKCAGFRTTDGFYYEWEMKRDKCIYYFVAKTKHQNGSRLAFRLNAIGYTSVPIPLTD